VVKVDFYDDYWRMAERTVGYMGGVVLSYVENNSRVLEIGCGDCQLLNMLKEKKHCDVYGVDLSKVALKRSKLNRVVLADIERDLFINSKFDYVIGLEVLEHLFEPEKFLSRIKPLARRFIFSSPNACYWKSRIHLLLGDVRQMNAFKNGQHLYYWNYREYMSMFERCGYKLFDEDAICGVL